MCVSRGHILSHSLGDGNWASISLPRMQLSGLKMFVLFCIFICASAGRFTTAKHVMTGQPHEIPANSTKVVTVARFAVVEFNKANTEDQFSYKIVNITSAKIQVRPCTGVI